MPADSLGETDFILPHSDGDGSSGGDTLKGGKGDDILRGGGGDDMFVFTNASSSSGDIDTIKDFGGSDTIQLSGFTGVGDFSDLQGRITAADRRTAPGRGWAPAAGRSNRRLSGSYQSAD